MDQNDSEKLRQNAFGPKSITVDGLNVTLPDPESQLAVFRYLEKRASARDPARFLKRYVVVLPGAGG